MLTCAVRMRPKVNHALPLRKSGWVNFSEAISPAREPRSSQKIDDVRKANAAERLERSASTLAASSADIATLCKASSLVPLALLSICWSAARSVGEMEG